MGTNNHWTTAEINKIIDGYRAGKSPEEIAHALNSSGECTYITRRTPNSVIHQAKLLEVAGIDLGTQHKQRLRVEQPKDSASIRARHGDLKFKRAMLRARQARAESFAVGVDTRPGNLSPVSQINRAATFVPSASAMNDL